MREPREYENPLCAEIGGDFWFPERDNPENRKLLDPSYAKSICRSCIHRTECAQWGIKNERFGIWGGLTEYERTLLRTRSKIRVKDWKSA
ncbi:MAG: WhiB family transcriptional regulator [Caulobacteraceae bacterium]|nr:WhiB family transcriptional regulator [Caulobacteraceae bacterium]